MNRTTHRAVSHSAAILEIPDVEDVEGGRRGCRGPEAKSGFLGTNWRLQNRSVAISPRVGHTEHDATSEAHGHAGRAEQGIRRQQPAGTLHGAGRTGIAQELRNIWCGAGLLKDRGQKIHRRGVCVCVRSRLTTLSTGAGTSGKALSRRHQDKGSAAMANPIPR